jgi:hypothetical protein
LLGREWVTLLDGGQDASYFAQGCTPTIGTDKDCGKAKYKPSSQESQTSRCVRARTGAKGSLAFTLLEGKSAAFNSEKKRERSAQRFDELVLKKSVPFSHFPARIEKPNYFPGKLLQFPQMRDTVLQIAV